MRIPFTRRAGWLRQAWAPVQYRPPFWNVNVRYRGSKPQTFVNAKLGGKLKLSFDTAKIGARSGASLSDALPRSPKKPRRDIDSVANVSLIVALDKQLLTDRVRKIPRRRRFDLVLSGIDTVLGR